MTTKQIEKKLAEQTTKYETAKQIREMLDRLEKTIGEDYDEDEMNNLIFGE